jgi:hypothetical protein
MNEMLSQTIISGDETWCIAIAMNGSIQALKQMKEFQTQDSASKMMLTVSCYSEALVIVEGDILQRVMHHIKTSCKDTDSPQVVSCFVPMLVYT